jgi:hypothetical protein
VGIFEPARIRKDKRSQAIEPVVRRADPLLRASFTQLDPRVMTIPDNRLAYAHFAFGAISELATEAGLDETQCLAALVVCLQRTPGFLPQDVSHLVGRCMNSAEQAENRQAREIGAQAVREWEAKVNPNVSSALATFLSPQPSRLG